jgi:hypothetical protein
VGLPIVVQTGRPVGVVLELLLPFSAAAVSGRNNDEDDDDDRSKNQRIVNPSLNREVMIDSFAIGHGGEGAGALNGLGPGRGGASCSAHVSRAGNAISHWYFLTMVTELTA